MIITITIPRIGNVALARLVDHNRIREAVMLLDKLRGGIPRNLLALRRVVAFSAGLMLAGCGAGTTLVVNPLEEKITVSYLQLFEKAPTIGVPNEVRSTLKEELTKRLYGEHAFQVGSDLKLEYGFVQFDPGSRATRWFLGGIGNAGQGSHTVQPRFIRPDGKELVTIRAAGTIQSGFFGGSFDNALEKAADEIAEYATANFLGVTQKSATLPRVAPSPSVPVVDLGAQPIHGVHFASYESLELAQDGWKDIWKKHWRLLADAVPRIEYDDSTLGNDRYKLYGRGLTKAQADDLCRNLEQLDEGCSVVQF